MQLENGCILGAVADLPGLKLLASLKPTLTWYANSARRILACQVLFCEEDKMNNDKRSIFDWLIWTLIHVVIIGAIGYAGVQVYGARLGLWVAASATVAGFASCYLFAKNVPGETLMKCFLYLCVALNAAYLVHNGARNIGIEGYNAAQVEKYERGMAEAGKTTSRRIARELRLGAKEASQLEVAFSDGVSVIVAVLAFLELASALIIFAISSGKLPEIEGPKVDRR